MREAYRAGHARAATAGARWAGGWPTALPASETVRYLELCRVAVTALRPDAPVVLLLPAVHRSGFYGGVHRRRVGARRGVAGVGGGARGGDGGLGGAGR